MASASKSKDIKVLTWNIKGLKATLADEDRKNKLLDIVKRYHIVLLQETHIGPANDNNDKDWNIITEALPENYDLVKLEDRTRGERTDEEKEEEDEDEEEEEEDYEGGWVEKKDEEEEVEEEEEEEEVEEGRKTMYMTYFSSNSKGVAIIINKTHTLLKDFCESGDYAWVHVEIEGQKHTFVSVYYDVDGPNHIGHLTSNISKSLNDAGAFEHRLVIGGDFNTTLDRNLDIKKTQKNKNKDIKRHPRRREKLNAFLNDLKLIDVWRRKHPTTPRYTYTHHNGTQSRLDYFFIKKNDVKYVKACEILRKKYVRRDDRYIALSDHSPVKLTLSYPDKDYTDTISSDKE